MDRVSFYKADVTELEKNLLENVIESKLLTVGPFVYRFEEAILKFLNAPYFLATSSGTSALHIAIKVMGWGEDDEVIISPMVHIGVPNILLIENVGMKMVDIDPENLSLDPNKVREVIKRDYVNSEEGLKNKETGRLLKGIVIYHLYGIPASMEEFLEIKEEFNLKVIEACWESFGSKYIINGNSLMTGVASDVGVFSFTRYGQINVGEGGGLVFKTEDEYKKADMLRYHGIPKEYIEYQTIMGGFNYNLDELSSAVGVGQMIRINEMLGKRNAVYEMYEKGLSDIGELKLINGRKDTETAWYSVVVQLDRKIDRSKLIQILMNRGIPTKVFYPVIFRLNLYDNLIRNTHLEELNIADSVASSVLSLPFYGDLTESEVVYVSSVLKDALRNSI
ncbi:MAG TPA: DegT/DnrJ/EryC1/StrS family aminotransferase [Candidatus Hydrothermia bacterium]|nr:DegT/DnrJ/EryC1/StrS family aminotransferase [Candidatus Hydrothermae bacterium]HOK22602.1 DegT/DnrJ/EryC1/StrS family aminotransferase [Candidatus Hydrothermia bacterium]HOL23309.1 DegT/DnrJ/EryC1/StrS family aminotransferase [Candidatus Hydrothermia bacterium]HOP32868.1 DegT/DnrJ/EryC1/StrS family aminotransferase [Candidatus Hydrothermia bacterium]HPO78319.1 DegT/DnrJ/EryC1/StrS family aminotransferase [Candidatus Hydrothermia bacterium]